MAQKPGRAWLGIGEPSQVAVITIGVFFPAVLVIRRHRPQAAEPYPFSVRDPLPTIALPLRQADEDHPLSLQAVLEEAWDPGGYESVVAHLRGRGPDVAHSSGGP